MKLHSFFILLTVPLLLTACGTSTPVGQTEQNQTQNQAQEKFSLKNALTLGQSLKCTYNENGSTVTSLIKGNKYKVDQVVLEDGKGTGGVVSDGEFMYSWDNVTKQGVKFNLKDMQAMAEETEPGASPQTNSFDFEEWVEETESKNDVDCQPALLTDAEFTPPSDVTFQDMTQFFQQMGEMSKQIETNPDGVPSAEDLEKLGEMFKGMGDDSQNQSEE